MATFRFDVSLRVKHPALGSDEICRALGMPADVTWQVGAHRTTPTGRQLPGVYEYSYCVFRFDVPADVSLADFIKAKNASLLARRDFLVDLRKSGGTVEYFVGWYSGANSGELFDWQLLKELADLRVDLALDVYAEDNATSEDG